MGSIIFGFHAYFCYFSLLALHWKYDVLPAYLVDCTKLIGHITKFSLSSDPGKNDDSALIVNAFISLVENKHKYTHKFIDFCEWLRLLLHDSFDGKVHPTCVSLCISATYARASQVALVVKKKKKKKKNLPGNAGDIRDLASIPRSGRSPGRNNGNPLQYSCLKSPMDRGAWWATLHRVAESDTTEAT